MNTQCPGQLFIALLSATLLLATLMACSPVVKENEVVVMPVPPTPRRTVWLVKEINGSVVTASLNTTIDLTASGQVNGYTGCNRYFGSVEIGEGDISFSALGGTRRACSQPLMDQEMNFYQAMAEVVHWEISADGQLHLRDANGDTHIRAVVTEDP